jgi:hypothetical protein
MRTLHDQKNEPLSSQSPCQAKVDPSVGVTISLDQHGIHRIAGDWENVLNVIASNKGPEITFPDWKKSFRWIGFDSLDVSINY